ncbi:MAG: fibrobacter succinogenes major paralogous domain-containing protein [Bacteroidales bacterium]|nr:fibrobacter succinogenes major paralogous domain-containing protein [Bacteroidales bacterium]
MKTKKANSDKEIFPLAINLSKRIILILLSLALYFGTASAQNSDNNLIDNTSITSDNQQPLSGSESINMPENTDSTFTDPRDGSEYKIVKIGNQIWMAENLRYLPEVTDNYKKSAKKPLYYVYGFTGKKVEEAKNTSNYADYGVLYNWVAAKSACPEGWHLPSVIEWQQLMIQLGGLENAGGKLKETANKHWVEPNLGATNETNFSALPGGIFHTTGPKGTAQFVFLKESTFWWSTDQFQYDMKNSQTYNTIYRVDTKDAILFPLSFNTLCGLSVRCIKNDASYKPIDTETETETKKPKMKKASKRQIKKALGGLEF